MWELACLRSRPSALCGVLFFVIALSGCKKDPPAPLTGLRIDDRCPGAAHCTGTGDNVLHVGASKQLINPTLIETAWDDANANNLIDPGETFTDTNGNGEFDAIWIAGFGMSRGGAPHCGCTATITTPSAASAPS